MNTLIRLTALTLFIAPLGAALAADREYREDSDVASAAVETLKSNLPGDINFQLDTVRVMESGLACIQYHVANDNRGDSPGQAVVDGKKVLRGTLGNKRFEEAWNRHCAG